MTYSPRTRLSRRQLLRVAGLATAAAAVPPLVRSSHAQDDPRLARARQKGKVTWYSTAFPENMREALAKSFRDRTGLDLSIYAGGGGQIVSRLRTERKTGAYSVDVIDTGDPDIMEAMVKDGILRKYNPKGAEAIHPDFKDPRGYFYGMYFWTLVLEYNTNVYKKETAPKGFDDLIDPRFKGLVVTADPARSTGGLGFVKAMVKSRGWEWIEKFVKNDPLVMSITSGIQPAVVKGERPIAIMTSQFTSKTLEEGGPIAIAGDEFLFGSPDLVGLVTNAPNPDGAELLAEHLLGKEAQELIRKYGPYACRTDAAPPFGMPPIGKLKLRYKEAPSLDIDPKEVADRFHKLLRAAK